MEKRVILYAEEGKVVTDGTIYGKEVYLAVGMSDQGFYEISEKEYQERMAQDADSKETDCV